MSRACHNIGLKRWRRLLAITLILVASKSLRAEDAVRSRDGTQRPNPAGHVELATGLKVREKLGQAAIVRVVCFGDSVTGVYYHTGSRRAYADMLGIALSRVFPQAKVEILNAGISGNTTVDGLARIDRDVLSHKPDLVTIMFGLNDMTRVSLDNYQTNLREMVNKCRSAGCEVVLATPNCVINTDSRPTETLVRYCDAVREVGHELKVPVSDVYRELDALRAQDAFDWRLMMSDAIHPNMDGHKRMAIALAETISGVRVSLDDVPPPHPAIPHTLKLLRAKKPVRVLAMPPYDEFIGPAIREIDPQAQITVERWQVASESLAKIEQDAKARVRASKPDLVLIAVPRSATANSDESFVSAYAWIMNWSLQFGTPTWDCVVVHPSVAAPEGTDKRDDLIRRLVRAQDLYLIDRPANNQTEDAAGIFSAWIKGVLMRDP